MVTSSLRVWPVLLLCLVACHRERRGDEVESLVGHTMPLVASPALRLVMAGALDGRPVEVTLDPASPVSFITSECLPRPSIRAHVKVLDPFGPDETYPIARVEDFTLGALRHAPFEAALAEGQRCVLVLGGPELKGTAIELDPARREVKFRPSQPKEKWVAEAEASGDDAQVLMVTRDPLNDWPLLPVRLRQGPNTFEGVMLLSLRDSRSRIYDESARAAGLRPGLELLEGLPLPEGVTLPPELKQLRGYAWDAFEFAPGFGLNEGSIEIEQGAPAHAPLGMLGADLWGRFHVVYDVGTGALTLRRPRVFISGTRAKCVRGGETSEEACFELHSTSVDGGVEVTATVWSPLPNGAQLSLDLAGSTGSCRIGITFARGDRGRSTHHRFPWEKLSQSVPGCADGFVGVTAVTPGLLEEGTLRQCPGVCAWARDAVSQRMSCECQPGARNADGEAEKRLLELFKKALEQMGPAQQPEPKDPE